MFAHLPVVVRGGGEMASAAAWLLFRCGFPVAVLELETPLAVRRLVCFAEALLSDRACVEGVTGLRAHGAAEALAAIGRRSHVPVLADPEGRALDALRPAILLDGRMAKRNLGTRLEQARVVIGLGPGLVAGSDVHAVVETQRGPDLGRVIWTGAAQADTATPAPVMGFGDERVLRAPRAGRFRARRRIGERVAADEVLGEVDGAPVCTRIGGVLRGLIADGAAVEPGAKLGDVDPRADVDPARVSDKGRAIAAGVLEAVLVALAGRAPGGSP